MSDQAVEFLKGWFETKLPTAIPPAPSRDKLSELAHQCEYDAHLAGLQGWSSSLRRLALSMG